MLKLPLTYTILDTGEQVTKEFYFNLNKADVLKIHLTLDGGFDGFLEKLKTDPDIKSVMEVFDELILKSYGKRTAEGKFVKSKELSQEFAASDAYSELFIKLLENENGFANAFIEGVMSVSADEIKETIKNNPDLKVLSDKAEASEF